MFQSLETETQLLIFEAITFAALLFVLGRYALKPVREALDSRQSKIEHEMESAEKARQESEDLKIKFTEQFKSVENETRALIAQTHREVERLQSEAFKAAQEEVARLLKKARKQLETDQSETIRQLRIGLAVDSLGIAEKVIQRSVDTKLQRDLLEDALEEIGQLSKV